MFRFFKKFFQKKPVELSEFEIFKFKKIAKKVYQLNYDLTHDKKKAKSITKSQLQQKQIQLDKIDAGFKANQVIKGDTTKIEEIKN